MEIYSTATYTATEPAVVALGCFDGIHVAHAEVITEARRVADRLSCRCTVWTFDEPPKNQFLKEPVPLLTDKEHKNRLISKLGADTLITIPFNKKIASISAEDFFNNIIVKRLKATHVVCGFDYAFGRNGSGNVDVLKRLCNEHNIGLSVIPAVEVNGITVSSSVIRELLISGDADTAATLLGRPYSIRTTVINGQHLARSLGFPTLNQEFSNGILIPRYGVYASRIQTENESGIHYGITNIGVRPTVGGTIPYAETHIFDFCEDLYGSVVDVELLCFIRPEIKFGSIEELSTQVNKDIKKAKTVIKDNI